MPESGSSNGERDVPFAGIRVDQQQCRRGSERRTMFRPGAGIWRHLQLRGKAGKWFRQTATEIIRQRSHAFNRTCSSPDERGKRALVSANEQNAEAGEDSTDRGACEKQEPGTD